MSIKAREEAGQKSRKMLDGIILEKSVNLISPNIWLGFTLVLFYSK